MAKCSFENPVERQQFKMLLLSAAKRLLDKEPSSVAKLKKDLVGGFKKAGMNEDVVKSVAILFNEEAAFFGKLINEYNKKRRGQKSDVEGLIGNWESQEVFRDGQ